MKILFYLSLFLFFFTTILKAEGLNYYGRIFYNGAPIQTDSAELTFQITGNDPSCVLYEEIHGNVMVKDGLINEIVGAVGTYITLTYRPLGLINVEGVFKNTFSYTCQNGATYNPLANPERNLVVYFRETPMHNPIKLDPKPIKAVPLAVMAQDAEKLAGKDPSSYLQVSAVTDQNKLDQLVLRQAELLSLIPASGQV